MNLSHVTLQNLIEFPKSLKWTCRISYEGEIVCVVKQEGRGGVNQYLPLNHRIWPEIVEAVISETKDILKFEHMDMVLSCCEEGDFIEEGIKRVKEFNKWNNFPFEK